MTGQPIESFGLRRVPEIFFGPGRAGEIARDAAEMAEAGPIVLITDAALFDLGLAGPLVAALEDGGAQVGVFSEFAGEPKQKEVEAATDFLRRQGAGLAICLGGGSAMDLGKVAAAVALGDLGPAAYAMKGEKLPARRLPCICIPTTAGTGSELSSTNIFSSPAGRKVWVWGSETKPGRVILDPELTLTLSPALTAWTGLDAFVHALEACTNVYRHAGNDIYAHRALELVAGSLEDAVNGPDDLAARGRMLLGAAYAGMAIDNCSAGLAHNLSHALAALAPVQHGLATALGLEVVLGWQAKFDTPGSAPFAAAARACGLGADAGALVEWYGDWLTRCGVKRELPAAFAAFSPAELAAEMSAPETIGIRRSSAREATDADSERFAAALLALAPEPGP
ncbi:MAG TPA: iron-containing alcohol dehydrogenase [Alphaproteobacteria bacterium]|jgi:alcohol dehydrogenase class IV|nr:iron-containing alcohol dehydrogenase [Alphaproteobacteria bacterium]MDP7165058.1 iron-containing alcohol dehydrogenase [Alphaproteobacteria bacterium]MDP7429167.1 iron-containing alcohol dehydrogenase [Alphaproteobacteria bacterium]HJM49085.1 iron-containing alcohol dehydrogenase [Alphaproteobacteria bacterium]